MNISSFLLQLAHESHRVVLRHTDCKPLSYVRFEKFQSEDLDEDKKYIRVKGHSTTFCYVSYIWHKTKFIERRGWGGGGGGGARKEFIKRLYKIY
jgi:hypothetical protein